MALLVGRQHPSDLPAQTHVKHRSWLQQAAYDVDHSTEVRVVVDLATVDRVCTEDLNRLIRLNARARQEGRRLILDNVQEPVWQVFTVTRLSRLFEIHRIEST